MGASTFGWRYVLAIIPLLLLAITLLAANQIAQPPNTLRPKIFVIGLSKTGTTSIGDALAHLGYKRLGWKDIRSRHLVHTWANGNYEALMDQTRYYDAFEDLPWPFMYREMAERYPDAKFILSLRKDEETWLGSMRTHVRRGAWQPYAYFYGTTQVDGHEETVLHVYRNHTDNVRAFFSGRPDRFAELNIDDGDVNWSVLCRVAQCPHGRFPSMGFPRSNTAEQWSKKGGLTDFLHFLWSWSITRIEEQSAAWYYRGKQSVVSFLLSSIWSAVSVVEQACSELCFKAQAVTVS